MEVNVKNSNNIISKVYKGSIAEEIGISQAQVSRLEKCGIEDLRKMIM